LQQIAHVVVSPSRSLKLFDRANCNYFWSIPTYVITVPERYRWTDRQTDDILWHNHALRSIAR